MTGLEALLAGDIDTARLGVALAVGVGVAAAHGVAHNLAGNRSAFDSAGVNTAGITVLAAATTATYIVLTLAAGGGTA